MVDKSAKLVYPRKLRPKELDLLETVLPLDRPGYCEYRELLENMVVLGEGRRGRGNLVLGIPGDQLDITSPLAPVIAYGMVETTIDSFSITVREYLGNQIDVEIVSSRGTEIPDHYEEKRRWTYSTWKPGDLSPSSGEQMREVKIGEQVVLGFAPVEKRILMHDRATGMNHLIPITGFYNELMLHKKIRDPKTALDSRLLFRNISTYGDEELRQAFISYNKLKRRVSITETPLPPQAIGVGHFLKTIFGKQKS